MVLKLFDFSHLGKLCQIKIGKPLVENTMQLQKFAKLLNSVFDEFEGKTLEANACFGLIALLLGQCRHQVPENRNELLVELGMLS